MSIEGTLGVKDINQISLSLYPNPVDNVVSIETSNAVELERMLIYNLTGKRVITYDLRRGLQNIDVSNLQSAQYFVVIKAKNGSQIVKRLLKK